MEACRKRLNRQVELIDPLIITTLGKVPTNYLLGRPMTKALSDVLGEVCMAPFPGRCVEVIHRPIIPNWHPAFILRGMRETPEGELRIEGEEAHQFLEVWKKLRAVWSQLVKAYSDTTTLPKGTK